MEKELFSPLNRKEIENFIKEYSDLIYEYINNEILKDIAKMNQNYFIKSMDAIFMNKKNSKRFKNNINPNLIPYLIFELFAVKGQFDYTTLRVETIDFHQINKEASVYYNYAKFTFDETFLCLDLMQTKIGGMPIDNDIIKFTKKIPIKNNGLEDFIHKNKSRNT